MRSQFIYASVLSLALLSCGRDQKTRASDIEQIDSLELTTPPQEEKTYNTYKPDTVWTSTPEQISSVAEHLIRKSQDAQFICITEADHNIVESFEFLSKPETLKALSDGGVKNIFLERSTKLQEYVDLFADGAMSENTFKGMMETYGFPSSLDTEQAILRHYEALAKIITNAKAVGIKTHFIDAHPENDRSDAPAIVNELNRTVIKETYNALSNDNSFLKHENMYERIAFLDSVKTELSQNFLYTLSDTQQAEISAYLENHTSSETELYTNPLTLIKKRLNGDTDLGNRIKITAQGEKSLVLYGMGHFIRKENDIDATLGNSFLIKLFKNADQHDEVMAFKSQQFKILCDTLKMQYQPVKETLYLDENNL